MTAVAVALPVARTYAGDEGPATAARLNSPQAVAVGPDGSVFISDFGNHRVRRIGPDGWIATYAGNGVQGYSGDGGAATSASLDRPHGLSVGPDGVVYVADQGNNRVRRIGIDGVISTIAGNGGAGFGGDGGQATSATLNDPRDVVIGPDGTLYVADRGNGRVRRIDADGVIENHLASVTDGAGNVTTIERANGRPTAIVAPGGQRTDLKVDANGWLASVSDPLTNTHTMTYSADGLLQTLTQPMGNLHSFTYDSFGRLTGDAGPGGESTTLSRTDLADGYTVSTTSALGRVHTYTVQRLPTGAIQSVSTGPAGDTTTTILGTDGSELTTLPNGSTVSLSYSPDPRWGMLAPVVKQFVGTTPGGKTSTITTTRTASLSNPANLFSLIQQMETVTDNGNTTTRVYDAATRTFTLTTPEGRTSTATLDSLGRMVSYQPGPGVAPVVDTYDAQGRLFTETHGTLSHTYGYDAANRLTSTTDGGGHATTYGYDTADRVTDETTPAGHHYHATYDANGNVTSITMPSGAVHTLGYTAADNDGTYTPPGGSALDRAYSADGEWISTLLAGGRTLNAHTTRQDVPQGVITRRPRSRSRLRRRDRPHDDDDVDATLRTG